MILLVEALIWIHLSVVSPINLTIGGAVTAISFRPRAWLPWQRKVTQKLTTRTTAAATTPIAIRGGTRDDGPSNYMQGRPEQQRMDGQSPYPPTYNPNPPPHQQQKHQQLYSDRPTQGYNNNQYAAGPPPNLPPPRLPDGLPFDEDEDDDDDDDDEDQDKRPRFPPPQQPYAQYPPQQQQQQPPYAYGGPGYGQSPPPLPGDPSMVTTPASRQSYRPLPNERIPPPYPQQQPPFPQQQQQPPQQQPPTGPTTEQMWDEDSSNKEKSGGMDLSSFDKEYILRGLARLYRRKILPLEIASRYGHFGSPPLSPSDFDAPPMILLLGQYSVGKTSFIKYLLGRDFPGIRIGPEPTTDRFTAVLWGHQDKVIPGAALCSQAHRPFTGLNPFGNNFLSRMEGSELDAPILKNVTLVDTPGILSGQKQRARNYDYEGVMKWFAERSDLIIIMFDAYKLDISDELKRVMHLLTAHSDKIRIVLNKADSVSTQQLMRVYGALMWQLGKVMNTPEVARVYMGSFWDVPLQNTDQAELLNREEMDLLHDITALPQYAVMRRINEMVKRARSVKVHAYIIHYLRKQLPYTWGKREKQKRLIDRLDSEFLAAARRYGLPKGDFPPLEPMRQALKEIKDLSEFPKLDKKFVREMDKVFSVDIPELLEKARHQ